MLQTVPKSEVMRPLHALVPVIQREIEAGNEERNRAGLEHYRRAGEALLEAKEQIAHGEWGAWLKRNFRLGTDMARHYMKLAGMEKQTADGFSSLRQATRPDDSSKPVWHKPVKQAIARVDVEAMKREQMNAHKERVLMRSLAHNLIDIGYKALASKLHPDKGGSSEAMARLNKVRNILKGAL